MLTILRLITLLILDAFPLMLIAEVEPRYRQDRFSLNEAATSFSSLGDLNVDGVPDFAVGYASFNQGRGKVLVYSGLNRSVLGQVIGTTVSQYLGSNLAAVGDINGDDIPDLLVGSPGKIDVSQSCAGNQNPHGKIEIYSGAALLQNPSQATVLYSYSDSKGNTNFGRFLTVIGNLDGTPGDEFAVLAPFGTRTGDECSDVTGAKLFIFRGGSSVGLLTTEGVTKYSNIVARIGDVNGDGAADYAVTCSVCVSEVITLFSGSTQSQAAQFDIGGSEAIIGIDDLNDDGRNDFIASADDSTEVKVISSNAQWQLSLLNTLSSSSSLHSGLYLAALNDVNGDQRNEFVSINKDTGRSAHASIEVFSGGKLSTPDQVLINFPETENEDFSLGEVRELGDLNQDGANDFGVLVNDSSAQLLIFYSELNRERRLVNGLLCSNGTICN